MQKIISKAMFIIGAFSAVGMIYLLVAGETNRLFYILMIITLSTWPLAQYVSRRKKKDSDSESVDS